MLLSVALAVAVFPQDNLKSSNLQRVTDLAMNGRAGAAVVAEVKTGELLAAHNLDFAARNLERPGSTVKPFVLMALLEAGKIVASQRLQCRRPLWICGVRMDCAHPASIVIGRFCYKCLRVGPSDLGGPARI